MTEPLTSSSVPVRASVEPQKCACGHSVNSHYDHTDEGGTSCWVQFCACEAFKASASPSDDGARQPQECPTCGSPDREMHPLTGRDDSEVRPCRDTWHKTAAASDDGAAREPYVQACVICEWPVLKQEGYICACCGMEQGYDDPETYTWDGEWWAKDKSRMPKILAAARARIVVLETSVDSLRYLIDHPVTNPTTKI